MQQKRRSKKENKKRANHLILLDSLDGDSISIGLICGDVSVTELAVPQQLPDRVPPVKVLGVPEIGALAPRDHPAALPLPPRARARVRLRLAPPDLLLVLLAGLARGRRRPRDLAAVVVDGRRRRGVAAGAADPGGGDAEPHVGRRRRRWRGTGINRGSGCCLEEERFRPSSASFTRY